MNKRWSRNIQCRVTWDNGACISLKTQLKHMCAYINTIVLHKRSKSLHRPTSTHNKGIVSHPAHAAQSIKTANISLQHIIRIEKTTICMFSNDPSFISKQEIWLSANRVLSVSSKVGEKKERYSAILWEKERWIQKQQNLTKDGGLVCLVCSTHAFGEPLYWLLLWFHSNLHPTSPTTNLQLTLG